MLTKHFEEDSANGLIVLPEYSILLDSLKKRQSVLDQDDPLSSMITEMVVWLEKYFTEALKCDSLKFATILNPLFRHRFFTKTFGPQDQITVETLGTFTKAYESRKTEHSELDFQCSKRPSASTSSIKVPSVYQLFSHDQQSERTNELKRYLEGDHPLIPVLREGEDNQTIDPDCVLKWWKVSHFITNPYLNTC